MTHPLPLLSSSSSSSSGEDLTGAAQAGDTGRGKGGPGRAERSTMVSPQAAMHLTKHVCCHSSWDGQQQHDVVVGKMLMCPLDLVVMVV